LELVQALDHFHLRYALIGGMATGYRSRPRFTQALDFLLEVPQLQLPGLLGDLQTRGFSFDTETTIREWTREHLAVLFFHSARVDWLKPVIPLYQHVLDSARVEQLLGQAVRIASAEGLILTKLLAYRTQDQADIENLLAANRGQLELDFIRRELQAVMDRNDPRMERFNDLVARFYLPPPAEDKGAGPADPARDS
jgi:hypothetical protein